MDHPNCHLVAVVERIFKTSFVLGLFPGLLANGATAMAQELPQAVRDCAFVSDKQLRLLCFDAAVDRDQLIGDAEQAVTELPEPDLTRVEGLKLFPSSERQAGLSWYDQRWELSSATKRGKFEIRPYKPVYLLPIFYNGRPNQQPTSPNPLNNVGAAQGLDTLESKFQLSLKTKVAQNIFGDNGDVWFGYTQSSRWQVYNGELSRPFRETNYEPEVMFTYSSSWSEFTEATGWDPKMVGLSLNHQSNGRALPFSRSWNRVIGLIGLERGNTLMQIRPWARLPEDSAEDDNPDITDYVGRMDYLLVHKEDGHEYSLLLRHNLRFSNASRGAVQFDWAFPIQSSLRGHFQWFSGYGESLIDYNHRSDYVGLGISLVGWY